MIKKITTFVFLTIFLIPHLSLAYVSVSGYTRADGTYVAPYVRSSPNGLKYDNYGYKPSQGLYNDSYGTRGSAWDTPTWNTDPDYYLGKSIYESNNDIGYTSSYTSDYSLPTYTPSTSTYNLDTTYTAPSTYIPSTYTTPSWYSSYSYKTNSSCSSTGYARDGECYKLPKNGKKSSGASGFTCKKGYTKYESDVTNTSDTRRIGCIKDIESNKDCPGDSFEYKGECYYLPDNANTKKRNTGFGCNKGYTRSGSGNTGGCVKDKEDNSDCRDVSYLYEGKCYYLPNNAVKAQDSGYICNSGYTRIGSENKGGCQKEVQTNIFGCDYGHTLSSGRCIKINIPTNGHLNYYGADWNCNAGYTIKYDSFYNKMGCVK